MSTGALLLAAALGLVALNLYDEQQAALCAASVLSELTQDLPDEKAAAPAGEAGLADPAMDGLEIDGHSYIGVVELPSLGLSLPVMDSWSYPNLKIAPCRYTGSAVDGSLIIAGHNYKSHFGGLSRLSRGDPVYFTDVDGQVYAYTVEETETIGGTDVEEMEAGDWDLTLFTCTYSGQSRATVRCRRELS